MYWLILFFILIGLNLGFWMLVGIIRFLSERDVFRFIPETVGAPKQLSTTFIRVALLTSFIAFSVVGSLLFAIASESMFEQTDSLLSKNIGSHLVSLLAPELRARKMNHATVVGIEKSTNQEAASDGSTMLELSGSITTIKTDGIDILGYDIVLKNTGEIPARLVTVASELPSELRYTDTESKTKIFYPKDMPPGEIQRISYAIAPAEGVVSGVYPIRLTVTASNGYETQAQTAKFISTNQKISTSKPAQNIRFSALPSTGGPIPALPIRYAYVMLIGLISLIFGALAGRRYARYDYR